MDAIFWMFTFASSLAMFLLALMLWQLQKGQKIATGYLILFCLCTAVCISASTVILGSVVAAHSR
jgi:hypothetical protein